jgi:hypothetical protein
LALKKQNAVNQKDRNGPWQVWAARGLVAVVLFWNLLAAFQFMLLPQRFTSSFQVAGVPGEAAVSGFGILFLMWQVPYVFALVHPVRFKAALWQALIMQVIGLVGESILLSSIPGEFQPLRGSILRFIIFDGAGVLILACALLLLRHHAFGKNRG